MPRLACFHPGWQNEHLASFLLSQIAFVAAPLKPGDDVGTDFLCTLFDRERIEGQEYLVPRNSFAVQVKPDDGRPVSVTTSIDHINDLEIPYFLGALDQREMQLDIYSGEYLPILFPHIGRGAVSELNLSLCGEDEFKPPEYFEDDGNGSFTVRCPFLLSLRGDMNADDVAGAAARLKSRATRILRNIASRTQQEYVFSVGPDGASTLVLAGPGSARTFRDRYKERLAEAFANMTWILDNQPGEFDRDEFESFRRSYEDLEERDSPLPWYLEHAACRAIETFEGKGAG